MQIHLKSFENNSPTKIQGIELQRHSIKKEFQ